MKELEVLGKGYKDDKFNITSLFFADDGMLLIDSIENAEQVWENNENSKKLWFRN